MPANTVKVDRSTPWGNPFRVGTDGTAEECLAALERLLTGKACRATCAALRAYRDYVHAHIADLRGKNLACWCKPGAPCHAELLLQMAN